jgi:PAS domain S-box-containing protein
LEYENPLFVSGTIFIGLLVFLAIYIARNRYLFNALRIYRERAERTEQERVNFESIIEQANDAILVIDIVDGRIWQANPSAAQLLGYGIQELRHKLLSDLHPKEYLLHCSGMVEDVWEKGGLIYSDIPFLTASGELMPVECSAKVAAFAGRPAIMIYARDIRERLRMEHKIHSQKLEIEQKNKDITDSINYAKRIQSAILPYKEDLKKNCPQSFVLFEPKDIVSGDFYWFTNAGDWLFVAAADCTGHGVPGALMSMIGSNILNEIIKDSSIRKSSLILEQLDKRVLETLKRSGEEVVHDGMDIAFCAINVKEKILEYAGANRPLVLIRNNVVIELKPDKLSIGGYSHAEKVFKDTSMQLLEGDTIYLFTDGYADQFGGNYNKKFKYKNLLALLLSIHKEDLKEQKKLLKDAMSAWKGQNEQVDDILVMGLRIS